MSVMLWSQSRLLYLVQVDCRIVSQDRGLRIMEQGRGCAGSQLQQDDPRVPPQQHAMPIVFPLLRRVQENRDAFGAQATELHVLRKELRRRVLRM